MAWKKIAINAQFNESKQRAFITITYSSGYAKKKIPLFKLFFKMTVTHDFNDSVKGFQGPSGTSPPRNSQRIPPGVSILVSSNYETNWLESVDRARKQLYKEF